MVTVGNPSFISRQKIRDFGLARAIYDSVIEKVGTVWENIESDRTECDYIQFIILMSVIKKESLVITLEWHLRSFMQKTVGYSKPDT